MKIALPLMALPLALVVAACGGGPRALLVVQTTDLHGQLSDPEQQAGESRHPGGVRQLAAFLDRLADDDERAILLVDSGDAWSGGLINDRAEGAVGVAVMNALGYEAMALGNHEFDYGPIGHDREGDAPFSALEARLAESRFPVLAANLIDKTTGKPPAWPNFEASIFVERAGFKVGFVGIALPSTPAITFPHVGERLAFTDPIPALVRESAALRQRGAELVFGLVHIGGKCEPPPSLSADLSGCDDQSELFQLARRLPEGTVDGLFGGHTHHPVGHLVGGLPVLQAPALGKGVAILEITARENAGPELTMKPHVLLDTPGEGPLANKVDAILRPLEDEVRDLRAEQLGARVARALTRSWERGSSLGSFVCDTLLGLHPDRDVCITNSGGLRKDIPAGLVTYGELYDALPFGNEVAYLDISGETLLGLLRQATSGVHGSPEVANLRLTVDRSRDFCPKEDRNGDGVVSLLDRDRLVRATLGNGAAIEPDRVYRVVTNSFLARGGDAWGIALAGVHPDRIKILRRELPVREQIAAYLREYRPVINSADKPLRPDERVRVSGLEPNMPCDLTR